jgi:hypothetical protein
MVQRAGGLRIGFLQGAYDLPDPGAQLFFSLFHFLTTYGSLTFRTFLNLRPQPQRGV